MHCNAQGNRNVLEALVPRLGLTPVAEALAQLVGADEAAAAHVPSQALAWVAHTSILPSLLALCAHRLLSGPLGQAAVLQEGAAVP